MGVYPDWMFPKVVGGGNKRPPPPELPKYDINEEAPKFNWRRLWYSCDPIEDPDRPKTGYVPDSDDKQDWRGVIKNNIVPLTPPSRYEFGSYQPKSYFWFDTPDYADPFKKLKCVAHLTIKYAGIATSFYAVAKRYPFDIQNIVYLIRRPFGRVFCGVMSGSLAVITVANARGLVDDQWNYVIGGFVAGAVVGRKNHLAFIRNVFMYTLGFSFVKFANETNAKIFPAFDFRARQMSVAMGSGSEYGFWSGDYKPKYFANLPEDPGRGLRTWPTG